MQYHILSLIIGFTLQIQAYALVATPEAPVRMPSPSSFGGQSSKPFRDDTVRTNQNTPELNHPKPVRPWEAAAGVKLNVYKIPTKPLRKNAIRRKKVPDAMSPASKALDGRLQKVSASKQKQDEFTAIKEDAHTMKQIEKDIAQRARQEKEKEASQGLINRLNRYFAKMTKLNKRLDKIS